MELWLPLVVVSTFLVALLLSTIPLTLLLHRLLDPIYLTAASKFLLRCCFHRGYSYLPPIWNGSNMNYIRNTLGILEKNYKNAETKHNFKAKPLADLPHSTYYKPACAPLCQSLESKLTTCRDCVFSCFKETRNPADNDVDATQTEMNVIPDADDKNGCEYAEGAAALIADQISTDAAPLNARNFTQSILAKTNGSEEEKTGQVTLNGMDLILWAIENDCHMLLKLIISDIGVDVDKQMLSKACTVVQGRTIGSPWTIKFLVDRVLHQTDETGFFFLEEDRDRVKSQRDKYHLSKRQHTMLIELLEKLDVLENVTCCVHP